MVYISYFEDFWNNYGGIYKIFIVYILILMDFNGLNMWYVIIFMYYIYKYVIKLLKFDDLWIED